MQNQRTLSVGELIDQLSVFPRDATVFFGGAVDGLTYYRTKLRGDALVQIEFNELVYRTGSGELVVEEPA